MIPFNDLKPQHVLLVNELEEAIRRVIERGWFMLGPEVEAFEGAFAAYYGVANAVGGDQVAQAITDFESEGHDG
jgi:dTDP-4-amino-4,6-dideoxygalactose transaminase